MGGRGLVSGKCFSNLSPVTRCLHGVIKGPFRALCLEGEEAEKRGRVGAGGGARGSSSGVGMGVRVGGGV